MRFVYGCRTGNAPFCPRNRRRRFPITPEAVLAKLAENAEKGGQE